MATTSTGAVAPFDDMQRAALAALMDLLIPASADGRMPAARALSLYDDVSTMRAIERTLFERGLADLDARSHELDGRPFTELESSKAKVLVDTLRNEGSAFIQAFVAQTVGRYVSHPVVMPLIGLEARPNWPKGHVVAEGDWSLLDVVKGRGRFWRVV